MLERRIELTSSVGLQRVYLTRLADNCIALGVTPNTYVDPAKAELDVKGSWEKNEEVSKCPITGIPFSLFQRRHHCRISGKIFHNNASNYLQPLPDQGLPGAQRIGDPYIGLVSMQQLEDVLLVCDKKSELLSLLSTNWKKCNRQTNELPVNFGNNITLRPGTFRAITKVPSQEVLFKDGWTTIPPAPAPAGGKRRKAKPSPYEATYGLQLQYDNVSNKLTVYSEPGLPHDIVDDRSKKRQQRQRKAEKRRRKEEAARQERAAAKAAEREAERQQLLVEKKYVILLVYLVTCCHYLVYAINLSL